MESGLITSWQIDGEIVETMAVFICLASISLQMLTVVMNWKTLLGMQLITKIDSMLKSRDFALPKNLLLIKTMFFPVVTYRCESWTVKKAENWRIDAFELWCWRRLLRVCWAARRSNQYILKEISPDFSLEGLMLKLKPGWNMATCCKELTHWKKSWYLERLKAGGEENNRGLDGLMSSPTQWRWVWTPPGSWWWTVRIGVLKTMGSWRVGHDWANELNWTELEPAEFSSFKHHSLKSLQNAWALALCSGWLRMIFSLLPDLRGWDDAASWHAFSHGGGMWKNHFKGPLYSKEVNFNSSDTEDSCPLVGCWSWYLLFRDASSVNLFI